MALPRQSLLTVLLTTSAVITLALGFLAWRLLDQQRDLDLQRAAEQTEAGASAMAASIRGKLAETGDRLSAWLASPTTTAPDIDGAVVITASPTALAIKPRGGLPYLPATVVPGTPDPVFAEIESLEYGGHRADAADRYRELGAHKSLEIRAGALVRLGRVRRQAGDRPGALNAYRQLATLGSVFTDGRPAALLGLDGQRLVLRDARDGAGERLLAERMVQALDAGEWAITRGTAEFYRDELTTAPRPESWTLAETASDLWAGAASRLPPRGLRISGGNGRSVLTTWRAQGGRAAAVVAFADAFLANTAPAGVRWQLRDAADQRIAGTGDVIAGGSTRAVGTTDASWTLVVGAGQAEAGPRDTSRAALIGMTGAMFVFLWGATYFIARALRRETEVAHLQSDFVAAVSHEFRSPLSTVRQMAEMLETDRIPSEPRRREYYRVIAAEAARLQRLVETLLNFGRLEAGAERYRMTDLDAATLVRAVVAELESHARATSTSIEVTGPDEPVPLRGDEDALKLALRNLLENAIKYSPDQPTVWIHWGADADRAAIHVIDRGLGIADDERQSIFRKFVRGRAAMEAHVKGTGVGLAMVQHIVTAHGGEIDVVSEVGRGSTFTVRLPVAS